MSWGFLFGYFQFFLVIQSVPNPIFLWDNVGTPFAARCKLFKLCGSCRRREDWDFLGNCQPKAEWTFSNSPSGTVLAYI